MPKVITKETKSQIIRTFAEIKQLRGDLTNEEVIRRVSSIFEVGSKKKSSSFSL